MNSLTLKRTHSPIRWTARILSLLSIAVLLLFMFGEGFNPFHLNSREVLLAVFFPLGVMLGMGLAWRWEAFGGGLTVLSFAAFYGIHWLGSGRFPGGIFFALFASPGLLFLLAGLATGRKARPVNP